MFTLKLNLTALAVDGRLNLELFDDGNFAGAWSEELYGKAVRAELIKIGWTPPPKRSKAPPCWPFSV